MVTGLTEREETVSIQQYFLKKIFLFQALVRQLYVKYYVHTVHSHFMWVFRNNVSIFLEYSISMFHWGTFPTMKVKFVFLL